MTRGSERRLSSLPRERVELFEEEHVVARGVGRTHWFVRVRDGWTRAASVPGAQVQSIEPGPGVVWRRRVELELPRGTRLLCVRTSPRTVTRTPLEFLESTLAPAQRVLRTQHRVAHGGQVVPDSPRKR